MFAIIHVLLFYTGNPSIYFAFMTYTISLLVDLLFTSTVTLYDYMVYYTILVKFQHLLILCFRIWLTFVIAYTYSLDFLSTRRTIKF